MPLTTAAILPIVLLCCSNLFMTTAWYGQLKFPAAAMWVAVLASWGIAFFEYCLQVPANRMGYGQFSGAQLKIMQEAITLVVFCLFAVFYLKEPLKWNYILGFLLIVAAVWVVFKEW